MLSEADREELLHLVGAPPLALKLSLARLADGEPLAATLRWLGNADSALPSYCVAGQAERARREDPAAWRMLLAPALFDLRDGPRQARGTRVPFLQVGREMSRGGAN